MDNRTEQVADGVWRIEPTLMVNVYLVAVDGSSDSDGLVLVDTATPGAGPRIVRSVRMLGLDPSAVGEVWLTHWHGDHTGSAARFARSSAAPTVRVGAGDLDVVRTGRRPSPPGPEDATRVGRLAARVVPVGEAVPDVVGVKAGEVLAAGAVVVATPGHTVGHVAYHLPGRGCLLAGDAVFNLLRPSRGPRFFRSARSAEDATLRRVADLGASTVTCGHGPPLTRDQVARLAARAAGVRAGDRRPRRSDPGAAGA